MNFRYPHPDNEKSFEKFCLKLLQRHWNNPHLELYGRRGEKQFGIDIIDTMGGDPFKAAQCKHHEPDITIPPSEVEEEVARALTFRPELDHYAILTSGRVTTQGQNAVIRINREHRKRKLFQVELFSWEKIEDLLDGYPEIADILTKIKNVHIQGFEASMSLGFREIATKLDAASTATSRTIVDAELAEAEAYLTNHDPQVAKLSFERIRKAHWDEISDAQRYRIKVGLANAAIAQGHDIEAGKLLLDAKSLLPDAERAQANEAVAYELLGKPEKAHELAVELRKSYPNSSHLLSCWIRTAPKEATLEELKCQTNELTEDDAQVNAALALRAIELERFEDAEAYAKRAEAANPEWVGPKSLLGQALLHQGTRSSRTAVSNEQPVSDERLDRAVAVLSETIELAIKQKTLAPVADCYVFRAVAKSMQGNLEGAEQDFQEAIRQLHGNAAVHFRYATFLLHRNRFGDSITQLRKSVSISPGVEAEFYLARALQERGQEGDRGEATEIFVRLALTDDSSLRATTPSPKLDLLRSLRSEALGFAIDGFIDSSRVDDAECFLAKTTATRFSDVCMKAAHANLRIAANELSEATALADEALRSVTDETPTPDLRSLALLLTKLERHKDALPIWQKVSQSEDYYADLRHLVRCAERVNRLDVVLKTCQSLRQAGVHDPWFFGRELTVLATFDVEQAVTLLEGHLTAHPQDKVSRLHLARLGILLHRPNLVEARPEMLPAVGEVTPEGGMFVVDVLRRRGDANAALRFAYDLFRLHYDDPTANKTLVLALMGPRFASPRLVDCIAAGPGRAIRYSEEGARDKWAVIEDSPNPNMARGEYAEAHPLAQSLKGKNVGESFVLSKTNARDRVGKVEEILPKYVHRVREIWDNWQIQFPEDPFVQVFRVAKDEASVDGGTVDFTDMKIIADERFERIKEAEQAYQKGELTLHLFATMLGSSTREAFNHMALRAPLVIHSNAGRPKEREVGLEALQAGATIVLDITALSAIGLLGLNDLVGAWRSPLVISQGTAAELRSMLEEVEGPERRSGTFGKHEAGYFFQPETPEALRIQAEATRAFVEQIFKKFEVRGCPDIVDIDPETREKLSFGLGHDAVESMLLARAPGHVLWTEDMFVGETAAGEFAVRRVWTQLVVEHANNTGLVSKDLFLTTSARLLGFRVDSTFLNESIILKAGEMASWDVRMWPFAQSLEIFAAEHPPLYNVVALAALTLRGLYGRVALDTSRFSIITNILEHMLTRRDGRLAIRHLHLAIPRLFHVDVVAAVEASHIIRSWSLEAFQRPKMLGPLLTRP